MKGHVAKEQLRSMSKKTIIIKTIIKMPDLALQHRARRIRGISRNLNTKSNAEDKDLTIT